MSHTFWISPSKKKKKSKIKENSMNCCSKGSCSLPETGEDQVRGCTGSAWDGVNFPHSGSHSAVFCTCS